MKSLRALRSAGRPARRGSYPRSCRDVGVAGEEAPGLELDQGGRDQQELGGDLEVEVLQTVQFGHIAIHDATQRDLVEVHLFVEDEVQEEVERPLEDLGLHVVGHGQSVVTRVWFVHPCSRNHPWWR